MQPDALVTMLLTYWLLARCCIHSLTGLKSSESGQWSMALLPQQSYQGNENRRGCLKVEIKCRKKKGLYTPCRSRGKIVCDSLSLDLQLHLLFVKGFSRVEMNYLIIPSLQQKS